MKHYKTSLMALLTLMFFGIAGYIWAEENDLNQIILSYLAQPKFTNSDFTKQITGTKANLEVYDVDEGLVYFSILAKDFNDKTLARLSQKPEMVEFGKLINGDRLALGEYFWSKPDSYFFRFPANSFRANGDKIKIKYGNFDYILSLKELADFATNKSIYGGYLWAKTGKIKHGQEVLIANHGAFVARPGETSLLRLANQITAGIATQEIIAQRLLDFVTTKLKYDFSDAQDFEVLKRPNEVLMTKGSDCTGKVILYASLLEQLSIRYYLLYIQLSGKGHITTCLEGNFANYNNLNFQIGGKSCSVAETTARGFQIGKSILDKQIKIKDIEFIQRPTKDAMIYHAKTGKPLEFD